MAEKKPGYKNEGGKTAHKIERRERYMYYVINYENGEMMHGEFNSYSDALNYAESLNGGYDFTIEEYDSEEDYEKGR